MIRAIARNDTVVQADLTCDSGMLEAFLRTLGYISSSHRIEVPHFQVEEREALQHLRTIVSPEVRRWCDANHEKLEASLQDLTPLKHGVSYAEVFIDLWHWVFGLANKHLVQRGMFFDPYSRGWASPGCVPAVIDSVLMPDLW